MKLLGCDFTKDGSYYDEAERVLYTWKLLADPAYVKVDVADYSSYGICVTLPLDEWKVVARNKDLVQILMQLLYERYNLLRHTVKDFSDQMLFQENDEVAI